MSETQKEYRELTKKLRESAVVLEADDRAFRRAIREPLAVLTRFTGVSGYRVEREQDSDRQFSAAR